MNDSDLRAELARNRIPHYIAAARVGLHPSVFALYTSGKRPIPQTLCKALTEMIQASKEDAPTADTVRA